MSKAELHNTWLALRATGLSYNKIAKRIGVSPRTQVKWEKKFEDKLLSIKSEELEFINEQLRLARKHRLERLSNQIEKLEEELQRRDISDVPTSSLMRIYNSLLKTVQSETEEKTTTDKEYEESWKPYLKILAQCTDFEEK